jgi:hypothetical protein
MDSHASEEKHRAPTLIYPVTVPLAGAYSHASSDIHVEI